MPEEKNKTFQRSGTLASMKTATDIPIEQTSIIESSKKILIKSTSSSSVDKSSERKLNVKITEIKSPSPIPEDPMQEEVSKRSTLSAISGEKKKVNERDEFKKEDVQEQWEKKSKEASEEDKSAEQKKEEKANDKDRFQQSENTQKNNNDNTEAEISKSDKENDEGKSRKVNMPGIPENVPIYTTKLRGKSKATGQIMGGWI